jgi:hypothetical protein
VNHSSCSYFAGIVGHFGLSTWESFFLSLYLLYATEAVRFVASTTTFTREIHQRHVSQLVVLLEGASHNDET